MRFRLTSTVELMSCPRTIIITEFSVLSVWKKTEISFSVGVGIQRFKFGISEWRRNRLEKFMDQLSRLILWISKMDRFWQETTKIKTFYSFGTSNQESWSKLSTSINQQTENLTVLLHLLRINPSKNWLHARYQDQTKSKS